MEVSRQLKIKTGVVSRTTKDWKTYLVEAEGQRKRIAALVDNNADVHDIRKQQEVLDETLNMMPDCKRRLTDAAAELAELIERAAGGDEELLANAQVALDEGRRVLASADN